MLCKAILIRANRSRCRHIAPRGSVDGDRLRVRTDDPANRRRHGWLDGDHWPGQLVEPLLDEEDYERLHRVSRPGPGILLHRAPRNVAAVERHPKAHRCIRLHQHREFVRMVSDRLLLSARLLILELDHDGYSNPERNRNDESADKLPPDFDATAHISEEIIQPELKAPWAISTAMLFTYVAGWLYNLVLCFTMGDIHSILNSPMAQPVAQSFYNVLGKGGGTVYTFVAYVILKFVTFTAMQALGRTIFAISRDRLLPFSQAWARILPLTGTPILAVWLAVACCIAINLIGLGSYTAIAGAYNVCAIALDCSYCIPIVCKLIFNKKLEAGPWTLGRAGVFVNIWACVWTLFITVSTYLSIPR